MKGGFFIMISSDFRHEARTKLSGKWGKAVCITLVYVLVAFVFGLIEGLFPDMLKPIVSLAFLVIEIPLAFGFSFAFYKLFNDEEVNIFDFFSLGFNNFKKSWGIALRIVLKIIVPFVLMIVSIILLAFGSAAAVTAGILGAPIGVWGIISFIGFILFIVADIWGITKAYYYMLANFIAFDNLDLTAKEAVEKSQEMMTGKRGKLFILQLTFIGWAILAAFTFGIGYLWLMPYIIFSTFAFYKFANGSTTKVEEKEEK